MWIAVAGVAALLTAYPAAFHAVQWLGAAYLGVARRTHVAGQARSNTPVLHIQPDTTSSGRC